MADGRNIHIHWFISLYHFKLCVPCLTETVQTSRNAARSLRTCPGISSRPLQRQTRARGSSGNRAHEGDYQNGMTSQLCSDLAPSLKAYAEPPRGNPCQTSRRFFFFFVSIGDPDPVLLKNTCSEANDVKTCGESDLHCRFERMVRFSVFFQKSPSGE